jgi:hypothetical protein
MSTYRIILEPYKTIKSRYHCPQCNARERTFTRYIDTETGEYIAEFVGKCGRENKCGYHYPPKKYFQEHPNTLPKQSITQQPEIIKKPISIIPKGIFIKSLEDYDKNNFITALVRLFSTKLTEQLISKYFIGTSNYWNGATVFWLIDINGNVRTGKAMLYNSETVKRVKDHCSKINWIHSIEKLQNFNLMQCFFGEHLLNNNTDPVAIVESEKTAIICSVYFPKMIWLACGSINNLNAEKCTVLKGRKVILYPDANAFKLWEIKAKDLGFGISILLEINTSIEEKNKGYDLADYLLRNRDKVYDWALNQYNYPCFWDY